MSQDNDEQIERYMYRTKKGGEKRRSEYASLLKKWKIRRERRRAKRNPECSPKYRKYHGWEF